MVIRPSSATARPSVVGRPPPCRTRRSSLNALLAALEPVPAPSQLMHGDLTGNVLFHDALPPLIIDLPN